MASLESLSLNLALFFSLVLCVPLSGPDSNSSMPLILSGSSSNAITTQIQTTKVGIIGAGAAGLYSALLLESLGIDYEILEASSRAGGRIFTHYFDESKWKSSTPDQPDYYDYLDMGAMRIPTIPYMDQLIGNSSSSLLSVLNKNLSDKDQLRLIPYIFRANSSFLYFNNVRKYADDPLHHDAFRVLSSQQEVDGISADFVSQDPFSVVGEYISDLKSALVSNFTTGFAQLAQYDSVSTREYLTAAKAFTPAEIDWLETINDATGHYDLGFPQMVFDEWLFTPSPSSQWVALEGGMSRLTEGMLKVLQKPVQFNNTAVKISQSSGKMLVETNDGATKEYDHVISTVPLGSLQMIDTSEVDIPFEQRSAIRSVNYDASVKIGMKFKNRWWEKLPRPIQGGESFTDLPVRMVVYPSYGIGVENAPGVVIASYTWAQDAHRLGSYISSNSIPALTTLVLESLAKIHNVSLDTLADEHLETFAYSWYDSPYSMGAFSAYGPDQFLRLLPILAQPAGKDDRFHLAGEGLSAGHQWIIGALDSARRCVDEILQSEGRENNRVDLSRLWGTPNELDNYLTSRRPQPVEKAL